jgi:hypothetical protein
MTILFYVVAALLTLGLLAALLARADAARMASALRVAGPIAVGLAGVVFLVAGRAGLGGMLISGAIAWFTSNRIRGNARRTPGRKSNVRTAALEMELDHDSGDLSGVVLAGTHEGKRLDELDEAELLGLRDELSSDGESLQLLETYLDGRFPLWRENVKADPGEGHGAAPASGPMSQKEAYQILGLEPGATAAEIRKAHRRLMQRLHPDLGGSSFLAARINEAKDILLSDHD